MTYLTFCELLNFISHFWLDLLFSHCESFGLSCQVWEMLAVECLPYLKYDGTRLHLFCSQSENKIDLVNTFKKTSLQKSTKPTNVDIDGTFVG